MNNNKLSAHFTSLLGETGVLENTDMSAHTTFKTGGTADLMLLPRTARELVAVLRLLRTAEVPYTVIGRGSNLLVSDNGLRGAIIKLSDGFDDVRIHQNIVTAQAGICMKALCMQTIRAGLCGLEFAGGIPGTLGGAVCMNAGAYTGEIKDSLVSVNVLDRNLTVQEIPAAALELSYRKSAVSANDYIVLNATFALDEGDSEISLAKMNDFNARRRSKQPLTYPSAGSTFKRPEGNYAGSLIEKCGLKGYEIGGAQVSHKHAGFIINTGTACSRDIYELILHVQKTVFAETGVELEPEVKFLGEF
ncbi:MAG: UDP-N-acetylmuramate dehydrogenase [Christensenella sp.]